MDAEQKRGGFIQFPLCLLSIEGDFATALNYCVAHGTKTFLESIDQDDHDSDDERLEHARNVMGFMGGTSADILRRASDAEAFKNNFEIRNHRTAIVRVPSTYLFEMRNGEWPENESRVYLAIVSGIGDKPYFKLGWQHITWRAAGHVKYTSTTRLTRDQVNYASDQLTSRGLLACFTYKRRFRYWSFPNKCSREQMARLVVERHLKNSGQLSENDEALANRMTAELIKPKP